MADSRTHLLLRYLRTVRAETSSDTLGDGELLRRFTVGRDEGAFELLLWRHASMVWSVCRSLLRDDHAAEDAFQATFLTLACKAGAIGREAPGGWLYRVACRVALKSRLAGARRQALEAGHAVMEEIGGASPEDAAVRSELTAVLHEEVERLAARYRSPIVLCYLQGKSHIEAARELGVPTGTVSGRLARARDLLRRRLQSRGVALPAVGLAVLAAESPAPAALIAATVAVVRISVGGGVIAAPLLALTRGVCQAMFLSKMKTALVGCVAAGLLIAAGGGVVGWASGGQGAAGSQEAPATGSKAGAAAAPAPVENVPEDDKITKDVKRAENESRASAESIGHMEQIAVAIANYEATYGHMPRNVLSASGSPILSWRVALLPYFGEEGFRLSRQFHMDEAWDSRHNKELLIEMPSVFQAGREPSVANTFYQVFDGKTTFYNSWKSVKRTNPLSRAGKLVLIEAGKAVPWTKPVDLPYDDGAPLPPLGGAFPDVIHAVELNGTVHSIPKRFNEKLLRNAITIEAKEPFSWEGLEMPASGVNLTETPAGRPLETALDDPKVTKSAESEQSTEDAKARRVLLEKLNSRKIAIENALAKNRAAMAEAAKSVSQLEAQQRIYDVELSVVRQQMAEIEFAKADKKDPRREPAATDDVQDLRSQLEETRQNVRRLRDEVEELKRLLKEKK